MERHRYLARSRCVRAVVSLISDKKGKFKSKTNEHAIVGIEAGLVDGHQECLSLVVITQAAGVFSDDRFKRIR
jgi:hypothetical protein